jgi:transcriptional regulator with XRE-family HTH domain
MFPKDTTGDRAVAVDPDLGQRHPCIQHWSERLQELSDATGLSLRQLAEHVPWSHSTLARYLSGERVVDEAWMLAEKLIELAEQRGNTVPAQSGTGQSGDLRLLYSQARQAYREQQRIQREKNQTAESPDDEAPADSEDASAGVPVDVSPDVPAAVPAVEAPRRRPVKVLLGVVAVAAVAGTVAIAALWSEEEPRVWQATIVGTWSAQYQQNLGVFRFRTPDIPGDTDKATYHEGTAVSIVCQSRDRRQVSDPTSGKSSPVWNRLSDGYWIPDLYTDLPKVSGEAPPLGIPVCS